MEALTEQAMGVDGISPELYQQRLDLVQPNYQDMLQLAQAYNEHRSLDVLQVIQMLQRLGKAVYIISAGNNPSVSLFAESLGVAASHVYCVDLEFDQQGVYVSFDLASPLVSNEGKATIIRKVRKEQNLSSVLLVGDGMNDYSAAEAVDYFVGYGGNFYREKLASLSDCYIKDQSLLALLPLVLTKQELSLLTVQEKAYYDRGLALVGR